MPTPPPTADTANLHPPGPAEVQMLSRGVISAIAPAQGLTTTQRALVGAVFNAMTGYSAILDPEPIDPEQFAEALAARTIEFRTRIVQMMVLGALVLRPIPAEVTAKVGGFAAELLVDESMLEVAQRFAEGSLGLAAFDFERNGYTATWTEADTRALHTSRSLSSAWELDVNDAALAVQWAELEQFPPGTLGRRVTEFYRARGFVYPGMVGSAPPLLAQHDWVHVLADFGTSVESELEVFAFIARANDDMHAFSLLAMVVSLFETGYLASGAGLFESSPGHLSEAGMAVRLADAMRRGALCEGSIDYLRLDWFEIADRPVSWARNLFGVTPKSADAVRLGSVGPWEPGGISPFQVRAGSALAETQGRAYDSFGAVPISSG